MDNMKLIEERICYLEKMYDDMQIRIQELEIENHRLNNIVQEQFDKSYYPDSSVYN